MWTKRLCMSGHFLGALRSGCWQIRQLLPCSSSFIDRTQPVLGRYSKALRTSRGTGRTNRSHRFFANVLLLCELLSTERVLCDKLPGSKYPASASHRSRQQRYVSSLGVFLLGVPLHKE